MQASVKSNKANLIASKTEGLKKLFFDPPPQLVVRGYAEAP